MDEKKQMTLYRFCRGFLYGYAAVAAFVLIEQTSTTIQIIFAGFCKKNLLLQGEIQDTPVHRNHDNDSANGTE